MTFHAYYNHECQNCGAYYIPYDETVPCPRCSIVEQECFDFIPLAVASLQYNLGRGGSYIPANVLRILFHIFETYRIASGGGPFADMTREALKRMDWGDQEYLRDHIAAIAERIHEQLDADAP